MRKIVSIVCNTWPEGVDFKEKLEAALGYNFELTEGIEAPETALIVYVRVPWNMLLKQCIRNVPEFKKDDKARKELKQSLSGMERALDRAIEKLEDTHPVLVLTEEDVTDSVAVCAELIKRNTRGI